MATKQTLKRPALAKRRATRISPVRPNKHTRFSAPAVIVLTSLLAIAGVGYVLLSQAGGKPYSRLDCTAKKSYMGVAGPSVTPPIPGYSTKPGTANTVPSRQACLDKSSEAMVAKIFRTVNNASISANQPYYQFQANTYIGFRSNPPAEYTGLLLAKAPNNSGFKALPDDKKVEWLYRTVLGRAPDKQGTSYWRQYIRSNGVAKTVPAFLAGSESLRKTQAWSNAAIATLPAAYRPEASECKNGMNKKECVAYLNKLQQQARQSRGEACKQYAKGGAVKPLCKVGSKGSVDDVIITRNIDGSNVTLNVAIADKFKALRQAARREAGINITAYDREGVGYGSFRTSKMQQLLVNRNIGAAPVGSSMHQWGLAIDFGCDRKSYSNSGAKCQNWMRANAGRFGFYNLPSEAWHYSTNGR
jgi:hypothetical protein